jgi:hypothetical protein
MMSGHIEAGRRAWVGSRTDEPTANDGCGRYMQDAACFGHACAGPMALPNTTLALSVAGSYGLSRFNGFGSLGVDTGADAGTGLSTRLSWWTTSLRQQQYQRRPCFE